DKAESHLRYGHLWVTVSSRNIWVQVSNADGAYNRFARKRDFFRPHGNYSEHLTDLRYAGLKYS
ncbi:hypothetical protein BU25DRAFT_347463, partial [Macroventuria anomochaeta]